MNELKEAGYFYDFGCHENMFGSRRLEYKLALASP